MKILFVCLGNICRSPMAEAVLRHMIRQRGLEDQIQVDSAGTGAWHAGEMADPRTLRTLKSKGVDHHGRARQLRSADFKDFDLIVAMDGQNLRDINAWAGADPSRVRMFSPGGIGDPYYGGPEGFETMYHDIVKGCEAILAEAEATLGRESGRIS